MNPPKSLDRIWFTSAGALLTLLKMLLWTASGENFDGLFCLLGYRQNVAKYHMNVRLYFDQPAFIYQVFAKIVVTSEKALHSSHCTTFCFFMGYSLFPICNVKYSDFSTFFRLMINIPEFLAMIRYSIFLFYPRPTKQLQPSYVLNIVRCVVLRCIVY